MKRHIHHILLAVIAGLACASGLGAEHVVITRDLSLVTGTVIGIESNEIVVRRGDGPSIDRIPRSMSLGILNRDAVTTTVSGLGLLVLADGQRLPGRAELSDGKLVWMHDKFGPIPIELERMQSLVLDSTATAPAVGAEDVVLLGNGDRIEGVIVSIGSEVSIERGREPNLSRTEVPLERVAALSLVNPSRSGGATRLWMGNGTVVDVDQVTYQADSVLRFRTIALAPKAKEFGLPFAEVRGLGMSESRLIPFASLAPTSVSGPIERYAVPAPQPDEVAAPLGLSDVRFSGPATIEYTLPAAALRFSAVLRLARSAMAWGDVDVVIRDGDAERWRGTLNAAQPTRKILIPMTSTALTIELLEGRHGPVQDQVIFERAMLAP